MLLGWSNEEGLYKMGGGNIAWVGEMRNSRKFSSKNLLEDKEQIR
jgi:hypothetical protein